MLNDLFVIMVIFVVCVIIGVIWTVFALAIIVIKDMARSRKRLTKVRNSYTKGRL